MHITAATAMDADAMAARDLADKAAAQPHPSLHLRLVTRAAGHTNLVVKPSLQRLQQAT